MLRLLTSVKPLTRSIVHYFGLFYFDLMIMIIMIILILLLIIIIIIVIRYFYGAKSCPTRSFKVRTHAYTKHKSTSQTQFKQMIRIMRGLLWALYLFTHDCDAAEAF